MSSSGSSSDVSKKIRAAIKAKLEELGVYVDEELPDYIMVMIANKKPKQQMKDDLQLFLAKNAPKFVDWLFEIFDRLQSASKSTPQPPPAESDASEKSRKKEEATARKQAVKKGEGRKSEKTAKALAERESREEKAPREKEKAPVQARKRRSSPSEGGDAVASAAKRSSKGKRDISPVPVVRARDEPSKTHQATVPPAGATRNQRHHAEPEDSGKRQHGAAGGNRRHDSDSDETPDDRRRAPQKDPVEVAVNRAAQSLSAEMHRITTNRGRTETVAEITKKPNEPRMEPVEDTRTAQRRQPIKYDLDEKEQDEKVTVIQKKAPPPPSHPRRVTVDEEFEDSPSPPRHRMSSQVQVQRRMPDPNSKESSARPSLFMKAMNDVKRSKSSISASAGYGNVELAKEQSRVSSRKRKGADMSDNGEEEDAELSALRAHALRKQKAITVAGGRTVVSARGDDGTLIVGGEEDAKRSDGASAKKRAGPRFVVTMSGISGGVGITRPPPTTVPPTGVNAGQRTSPVARKSVKQRLGGRVVVDESESRIDGKRHGVREGEMNKENQHARENPREERQTTARIQRRVERSRSSSTSLSPLPPPMMQTGAARSRTPTPPSSPNEQRVGGPAAIARGTVSTDTISRHTPVWDGQIKLDDEEDSSGEDEDEIDAVLASASVMVSGSVDQELPPTTALTRPVIAYYPTRIATPEGATLSNGAAGQLESQTRMKERCRFWPGCRMTDEQCPFVHPSAPCKTFPNCAFGDRCLYIHPPCKFDPACTRAKCPFTHGVARASATMESKGAATIPLATVVPVQSTGTLNSAIACKFAGKCTNATCTFKHPKPCRFGASCTNTGCYFYHPPRFTNRQQPLPPAVPIPTIRTASKVARYSWKAPAAATTSAATT